MSSQKVYRQHKFVRPPGATEILLVRHGESRAAVPGEPFPLVDGQGDPELAENGQQQAEKLGERLSRQHIDAIYVTNLCRTAQTAAPLCRLKGMEPKVEADLREVHLGDWEGGIFRIKVHENDPIIQEMRQQQRWDVIPGAESNEALHTRTMAGLKRITAAHPDQLVVVVSHGGVIAQILAHATGSRPFAFSGPDNASISHIVVVGDEILLRRFNDTSHLSELMGSDVDLPT
ncbi:MAG: histidine phosphatase family protein [Gammaproteobacteria bacterium]|nr:histidine phosphatase family protein [Gammaproteobacteria bacterium]